MNCLFAKVSIQDMTSGDIFHKNFLFFSSKILAGHNLVSSTSQGLSPAGGAANKPNFLIIMIG